MTHVESFFLSALPFGALPSSYFIAVLAQRNSVSSQLQQSALLHVAKVDSIEYCIMVLEMVLTVPMGGSGGPENGPEFFRVRVYSNCLPHFAWLTTS